MTRLENTARWRWQKGGVVIWNNRATQHYAINDYGDAKRVVRAVALVGEVPVGVEGNWVVDGIERAVPPRIEGRRWRPEGSGALWATERRLPNPHQCRRTASAFSAVTLA